MDEFVEAELLDLIARLAAASREELPNIAREIFKAGYDYGFDVGCAVSATE